MSKSDILKRLGRLVAKFSRESRPEVVDDIREIRNMVQQLRDDDRFETYWKMSKDKPPEKRLKFIAPLFDGLADEENYQTNKLRLTKKQVKHIKTLLDAGLSPTRIANMYNANPRTIRDIMNKRTHRDVT